VIARSRSWSPPLDVRRAAAAATVGIALFVLAWALLHVGFWDDGQIVDTPVYQRYGDQILDGQVPYRDVDVEYPPAALPAFVFPSFGRGEQYRALFETLMLLCGVAAVALAAFSLAALGASTPRLYGAVAFIALAPLLLGSVILTRYDLWPAALVAASVAALLAGPGRLGFAALGLAVAAKAYPLVLLPIALLHVARRDGRREAVAGGVVFAAVVLAAFLPFFVLAPGGLAESFERQAGRPLQIESLGAAFLLAGEQLGLYVAHVVSTYGSQNLDGSAPETLATLHTVAQALAVATVWIVFARRRSDPERFVAASAGAVVAFVAFGKVLSPQYLIWLIPLVPLVGGAGGFGAAVLLAAALVLTQVWFPTRYWDMVAFEPVAWLVLLRDLTLVALFAVLVALTGKARGSPHSA
jgi:hypothetical protein